VSGWPSSSARSGSTGANQDRLANLVYNVKRLIVLERKGALATA
jgi:hypothetical protein